MLILNGASKYWAYGRIEIRGIQKIKAKILIYGQKPPPYHGCNIMTAFFLGALKEGGVEAEISEKSFSKDIEEVNKINILKFFRYFPNIFRFIFKLIVLSPDLVVFFISGTKIGLIAESLFILTTRLMGIRYFLYLEVRGYKKLYDESRLFHRYLRWLFGGSDRVIVLGGKLKEEIESFCNSNIYIVPNCIESKERIYFEKGTTSDIINILYLSNITKSKGAWALLKVIPEIVKDIKNVKFTIAGPWQDRKFKNEVMEYVYKTNIKRFVEFPGPVYGKAKDLLFKESDIFVFPTGYPLEAMPLVILEAMRASLPVISTNVGAISEVVIDGETGFIVQPDKPEELSEKIICLMKNTNARSEMGRKGRERFEEYYSLEAYKSRIKEVMKKVLWRV